MLLLNYIKENKKKFIISFLVFGAILFYIILVYNNFFSGGFHFTLNPIALFKGISGFPVAGFFIAWILIYVFTVGYFLMNKYKELKEDERNFKYSKSGIYGTAGMADIEDLKEKKYACVDTPEKTYGKILGQLDQSGKKLISINPKTALNRHIAVVGASGSGKSRALARPYIIQCVKKGESIVVTDPKGELYESTAKYLMDHGYKVRCLNLVHPEKSHRWDCLNELKGDEIRAQIFADVVIKNTGDGKGDVWDNAAMALLKALLLRVERGDDYEGVRKNFGEAYKIIQNRGGEDYLDQIFAEDDAEEQPIYMGPYMTFKQGSPNMRGNIITGLATRLQVLQNKVIRDITSGTPDDVDDTIDLTAPADEKCAYFCIMSDQHSTLNFLSTLFFSFLFIDLVEHADASEGNRCKIPVNFLLDEFPNIGSIPDFDKKIATVRSRFINIVLIFQNIPQMMEKYPLGKWEGILGNCDTMVCLGANDQTTAEFLSERTGIATVQVQTEQVPKFESMLSFGHNKSTGDGKRQIMNADEILRMEWAENLIIFRGQNVLKAYKYDFSKHPESSKFEECKIMRDIADIDDRDGRWQMQVEENERIAKYNELEELQEKEETTEQGLEIQKRDVNFNTIKHDVTVGLKQFKQDLNQRLTERELERKRKKNELDKNRTLVEQTDLVYDVDDLEEIVELDLDEDFGEVELEDVVFEDAAPDPMTDDNTDNDVCSCCSCQA